MSAVLAPDTPRTRFIGGSDVPAILGISPWKSALDLYLDKVAPQPDEDKAVFQRGKRLEPYIVSMIEEEYGYKATARGQRYVDPQVPYFAAEIDVLLRDGDRQFNGEIKTVHPFKAREWSADGGDTLPIHYAAQVQWGMGVNGAQLARVFALIGDDLRCYTIERDDETIAAMRERAQAFWTQHVVPRDPPPPDFDDDRTLAALKRLYPGTSGQTIDASDDLLPWRAVLEDAQAKAKQYAEIADGAKAHLLAAMGESALLRFADGYGMQRKTVTRKGYTVEPSSYVDARIVKIKEEAK